MSETNDRPPSPATGRRSNRLPAGPAVYAMALAVAMLATSLRWMLTPWMGLTFPYAPLFGAVAVVVWLWGWGPAVLAGLAGYVAATWLLVEPAGRIEYLSTGDWLAGGLYWLSCGLIIWLGESTRRSQRRAELTSEQFRAEVRERERLQGELQLRSEELEQLLRAVPAAVWIAHDPSCSVVTGNAYVDKLHGSATGTNLSSTAPPQQRKWARHVQDGREMPVSELPLQKTLATGAELHNVEFGLEMIDGRMVYLLGNTAPLKDPDGRVRGAVAACLDVTVIKEAMRRVEVSERRQRIAVDAAGLGVFEWNARDDVPLWENDRMFEIFGRSREDGPISKAEFLERYLHPEDREMIGQDLAAAAAPGGRLHVACRIFRGSEREFRWLEITGNFLAGDAGHPGKLVGVIADVTERKRAEQELVLHREHLEQLVRERTAALEESHRQLSLAERLAALGTLSAGLGHDMGNILAPMRLALGELKQIELSEPGQENVQILWRSTEYLKALAAGLRLLALDPETDAADSPTTRLDGWWEETSRLFGASLPRGVRLEAIGLDTAPQVAIPPHALAQIVFNLVQNAGDALRSAGTGTIRIEAADTSAGVRLTVGDDGPGMTPEVRARCMEPFFTTKAKGRGTGFGLAIVERIASLYHGAVEIQTSPGAGCAVTLLFPRVPAASGVAVRAAICVRDPRAAAVARSLLTARGTQLLPESMAPAGPSLWVVDAQVTELEVARFVESDARRCVVRLGCDGPASARVFPVIEPKATEIRNAISLAISVIRNG